MTLASQSNEFTEYVRLLARGRKGSRDLTREEAKQAMSLLLADKALPEQIGAFFMLMRVKEETSDELAGFAEACFDLWKYSDESNNSQSLNADIIWPSYAGKRRQPLWYILSMQLLNDAGYSILCHGASGHIGAGAETRQYLVEAFEYFNMPIASSKQDAQEQINTSKITYLACEHLSPHFKPWLMTKQTLGLRSPINTLLRLIAPQSAKGMQSVFHPNYAQVHQQACHALGKEAVIFKGEGGEIEANPERKVQAFYGAQSDSNEPEIILNTQSHYELKEEQPSFEAIATLWQSEDAENTQPYGYLAVIYTTALGLKLMNHEMNLDKAIEQAKSLWQQRNTSLFKK